METDRLLLGARGDFLLICVVRRHVHDKRGFFGGEKVWEGEQKQALFLLGRFLLYFRFLSLSSRLLAIATIPLFYVHTFFLMHFRLSELFFRKNLSFKISFTGKHC